MSSTFCRFMKKNIPIVIYLSAILCLFLSVSSQSHAADEIYTDDNTLKRILENGMTVVIHEMPKAPIASIDIVVKAGSATEGPYSGGGISHFIEHMVFKGKIEKKGESYGEKLKSLGGDMNAFTSHDITVYYATVPSENTIEALKILRDLVVKPDFDALELKKEKEVVLDEIRKNRDNPARKASDYSWQLAFQKHPYKYPVIGYRNLLERLGKPELEDYYSWRYSPDRMILVVSGDVRKDELFTEVESIFGPVKRNFIRDIPHISEPLQLSPRERTEYADISLAHVSLSYRSVSIDDPALYPLDVLAIALGAGEDSILTKELRNKRRLVHHISCRNPTLCDSGLFSISFTADAGKVDSAIAAVLEEIEKIENNGLGDDVLRKVQNIVKADLVNSLETVEGRRRDISISEAVAGDYNFSEKYIEMLSKVTNGDVKSAAKDYLKRGRLNTVRILPRLKEESMPEPGTIRDFSHNIVKHDMKNGIRVLVTEDHSTANCSISAVFLGGVRAESKANNGVSHLMSALLLDGTTERTEEEIKREIESRGGSIHSYSANNSFGVRISLLSGDWQKGIEVLSDVIMNPAFPKEKIEKEKTLTVAAIKGRDDDIIRTGFLLFKKNFYKEHPYRFHPLGDLKTIDNIKRSDILEFYNALCVPENMIIAVSGDIDTVAVTEAVKRRFGDLKRGPAKLPRPPGLVKPEGLEEASSNMKREQSMIIVGFPSVKLSDNDRYIFKVIHSITSGYNGRMFKNIREKLGMSYIVGASYQPGLESGCFMFYALSTEENIETIKEAMLKEIKRLREDLVPEDELLDAKRFLITQTLSDLQSNASFSLTTSLDELYGLGYKNYEDCRRQIDSVTPSQIKRIANQYFDLENRLLVTIYGGGDGG